jgi:hypothetical protein
MTEHGSGENISAFCDELRGRIAKKIETYQTKLKEIQLVEDLHKFGDLGEFERSFIENELSRWLNYSTSTEENEHVEYRLARLPFEQAYCYKNPEFHTKSRKDVLKAVFNEDSFEWRDNPALIREMSVQGKLRAIKRFEYMCSYVINRREELVFDLSDKIE